MQICERTGLNANFAVDCLQNNAWNLESAIANYEEVKVRELRSTLERLVLTLSALFSRGRCHAMRFSDGGGMKPDKDKFLVTIDPYYIIRPFVYEAICGISLSQELSAKLHYMHLAS